VASALPLLVVMNACPWCSIRLSDSSQLCAHHLHASDSDWAWTNRIMCDFLHRAILPARTMLAARHDDRPPGCLREVA
jgi:hypothetical protein